MSRLTKWLRNRWHALPAGVTIGRGTYGFAPESAFLASEAAPLRIGSYCSIAQGAIFMCHAHHDYAAPTTYPLRPPTLTEKERKGITIGNDVWVGLRAVIMSGVTVGDGAVIGTGAIVTRDVPPYAIVVGSPAKVLKYRFDADTIRKLQSIRWWDWPEERIRKEADLLTGSVEEFLARYEPATSCLRQV